MCHLPVDCTGVYDFDGVLHSLRHRLRRNDTEICGVYKQHYRGVTDVGVPNVGHRLSSQAFGDELRKLTHQREQLVGASSLSGSQLDAS